VRVAVLSPVVVGSAATLIVQEAEAAIVAPQVSAVMMKSPEFAPVRVAAEQPVAGPRPELFRVKTVELVVVPIRTFPNPWVRGVNAKLGGKSMTEIVMVPVLDPPAEVAVTV
jgi:hypothetical protein